MDLSELRKVVQAEVLRFGKKIPTSMKLDHYINLGGRAFLADTRLRRSLGTVAVTTHGTAATGHHTFTTHADMLDIVEVYHNSDKLVKTSREELSVFEPDWQTASDGTPDTYLPVTGKRIRVYTPVVLADAGKVTCDLVLGWSSDMTIAGHTPADDNREIPEAYHIALADHAAWKLTGSAELQSRYNELVNQARVEVAKLFGDVDMLAMLQAQPQEPQESRSR